MKILYAISSSRLKYVYPYGLSQQKIIESLLPKNEVKIFPSKAQAIEYARRHTDYCHGGPSYSEVTITAPAIFQVTSDEDSLNFDNHLEVTILDQASPIAIEALGQFFKNHKIKNPHPVHEIQSLRTEKQLLELLNNDPDILKQFRELETQHNIGFKIQMGTLPLMKIRQIEGISVIRRNKVQIESKDYPMKNLMVMPFEVPTASNNKQKLLNIVNGYRLIRSANKNEYYTFLGSLFRGFSRTEKLEAVSRLKEFLEDDSKKLDLKTIRILKEGTLGEMIKQWAKDSKINLDSFLGTHSGTQHTNEP